MKKQQKLEGMSSTSLLIRSTRVTSDALLHDYDCLCGQGK